MPKRTRGATHAPELNSAAQRGRLLEYLEAHGQIATSEARTVLAVMSPAARVMELRAAGFDIETRRMWVEDESGVPHFQGVYALRGGAK